MNRIFIAFITIISAKTVFAETQQVDVMRMACTELKVVTRGSDPRNTLVIDQIYDPMRESGNHNIPTLENFLEDQPDPNRIPFRSRGVLSIHPGVPSELTPEAINEFLDQPDLETELSMEGSIDRTHRLVYDFQNTAEKVRMIFNQRSLFNTYMHTGVFPTEDTRLWDCTEPYRVTKTIEVQGSEEETLNEESIVVN